MGEGLSHWSNMVLRKSQTYFFDRHTHPNSMYSNFCHVLKSNTMLLISQYQNMGGARSVRLPRKGTI